MRFYSAVSLTIRFRERAISSCEICGWVPQDEEGSEIEERATLQTVNKRLLAQIEEQVTKIVVLLCRNHS